MPSNLFIPTDIKVGFDSRSDTFTGQLGYVIYYDAKGKLRKEQSWNSWRDHSIEPMDIKNVPTAGFMINKGIKRDNYWQNSGRTVMRLWHPDNFEFEVSVSNFIEILTHSDLSKREIAEKCVFAWDGTELVLLPVNTQDYIDAQAHTAAQSMKVSNANLKVGATYQVKTDRSHVVYLGKRTQVVETQLIHDWDNKTTEVDRRGHKRTGTHYSNVGQLYEQKPKPVHTFMRIGENSQWYDPMFRDASFLSTCVNEDMYPEFASLIDREQALKTASLPVSMGVFTPNKLNDKYSSTTNERIHSCAIKLADNVVAKFHINIQRDYSNGQTNEVYIKIEPPTIYWFEPTEGRYYKSAGWSSYHYYNRGVEHKFEHPTFKSDDEAAKALQAELQTMVEQYGFRRPSDTVSDKENSYYSSDLHITDEAKDRMLEQFAKRGWGTHIGLNRENGTIHYL